MGGLSGTQPTPNYVAPIIDKYDCQSVAGVSWYCDWAGSVTWDQDPYWFQGVGGGGVAWTGVDCEASADDCRFVGGGSEAGTYPSRDKSICLPDIDPNCELVLPDSMKTRLRVAIADFVKPLTQISDVALRARCQAMMNEFNRMLDGGLVFIGGSDTPLTDVMSHYGAYDTQTHHIHFDPWAINGATKGSNLAWQISNTGLHEAAHSLGFEHSAPLILNYRGRTPVYEEDYFKDLNPGGGSSCMKT